MVFSAFQMISNTFLGYRTCGPMTYWRGVASVVVVVHSHFYLFFEQAYLSENVYKNTNKYFKKVFFFFFENFNFSQNGGHFLRKTRTFGLCRSISQNLFNQIFSNLEYQLLITRSHCNVNAVLIESL